ncbi:MAG: hypothetical protein GY906_27845 [bacterium]|nr:hypothetical protein [bacterium]
MARHYPNGPGWRAHLTGLNRAAADLAVRLRKLRLDYEHNNDELFQLLRRDAVLAETIAEEERALAILRAQLLKETYG